MRNKGELSVRHICVGPVSAQRDRERSRLTGGEKGVMEPSEERILASFRTIL